MSDPKLKYYNPNTEEWEQIAPAMGEFDEVSQNVNSHLSATGGVHGATANATANQIIKRDGYGRAKVGAPLYSDDIARKGEVDTVQESLDAHLSDDMPHKFIDGTKTYKWGLSVVNGVVTFNYEEVI